MKCRMDRTPVGKFRNFFRRECSKLPPRGWGQAGVGLRGDVGVCGAAPITAPWVSRGTWGGPPELAVGQRLAVWCGVLPLPAHRGRAPHGLVLLDLFEALGDVDPPGAGNLAPILQLWSPGWSVAVGEAARPKH